MTRNMPIQCIFFIKKFWEQENYMFWFLYSCIFDPNTTTPAPASWSQTVLVLPWDVVPSPCSLIHCSWYLQVLVWCTNSSSPLHFQQKFSYFFSVNGYLFFSWWKCFSLPIIYMAGSTMWKWYCWDGRWKVVHCSHASPLKTFPSDLSPSVWAIYAVLIQRRKNYCLTATPHPLLTSKVELGFS